MIDWTNILTIINLVIALLVPIGGYFAVRYGLGQVASGIQDRVRQGLLDENELLQTRLTRCEAEVERLKRREEGFEY